MLDRTDSSEVGIARELGNERAAAIAMEEAQQNHNRVMEDIEKRSQMKAQKLLGESWETIQQPPISPVSYQDRERNVSNTANKAVHARGSKETGIQRTNVK